MKHQEHILSLKLPESSESHDQAEGFEVIQPSLGGKFETSKTAIVVAYFLGVCDDGYFPFCFSLQTRANSIHTDALESQVQACTSLSVN